MPPQLAVGAEKGAGLGGAGAGLGVHVAAGGGQDPGAGDEAAAEGAGEGVGGGGSEGPAVLVEAVGVAVAGVAEEGAAAAVVGGAEEEDGVVGVVHAHRAPDVVELVGGCGRRGRVFGGRGWGEGGRAVEGDGATASVLGHVLMVGGGGGGTLGLRGEWDDFGVDWFCLDFLE